MTLETMDAAVTELQSRRIDATLEYPGFIEVPAAEGEARIAFGDANNDTLEGNVSSDGWETVSETIESSIPSDCTDAQRVADHIACYSKRRIS